MSDEELPTEGQTSEVEDTSASSTDAAAITTKDIDQNRDSIKDTLKAAVEKHREPSPAKQAAAAARSRAEDGKFAPEVKDEKPEKDTPDKIAGRAEAKAKAETPTDPPKDSPPAPEAKPVASTPSAFKPPTSWAADAKATWDQLPPAVQSAVSKREEEVAKGFQDYQNRFREIDQVFTPARDEGLRQLGKTRGQAVAQLFNWFDALANPATRMQAYHQLGVIHGIQPQPQPQSPQGAAPEDPSTKIALQYINPLQQQMMQQEQRLNQINQFVEQQTQARVHNDLAEFAKTHPHYEAARYRMGELMKAGVATTLEDAYQQAIWANPELRSLIQQEEAQKLAAEQAEKAKAEAEKKAKDEADKSKAKALEIEKARRAGGVSLKSSTPATTANRTPKPGAGIRDSIKSAIKETTASY